MSFMKGVTDVQQPENKLNLFWVVRYKKCNYWDKKIFSRVDNAYDFYEKLQCKISKNQITR